MRFGTSLAVSPLRAAGTSEAPEGSAVHQPENRRHLDRGGDDPESQGELEARPSRMLIAIFRHCSVALGLRSRRRMRHDERYAWGLTHAALALLSCGVLSCIDAPTRPPTVAALGDIGDGEWAMVSAGRDHSCALTRDGRAFCWGSNDVGQLLATEGGPSSCRLDPIPVARACSTTPLPVLADIRFLAVSAGGVHTCGLAVDRTVYCWGDNSEAQLGDVQPARGVVHVVGTLGFASVSAGALHTCGVRTDGALFCWGRNDRGQLGTGDKFSTSQPARVASNLTFASVSAGDGRTCARTTLSVTYCWGAIWLYRQNGLEFTRDQLTPERVPNAPPLTAVSVGSFTTCGAGATGILHCWEANPHGQMGTGNTEGSIFPLPVASGARFENVSAGIIQTCAVAVGGTGYCWGNDTFGQLGVPPGELAERCASSTLSCATRPTPVYGHQRFVAISTGLGNHSCGVSTRGNLYCWGLGWLGQLGGGTAPYREVIPVLVASPR